MEEILKNEPKLAKLIEKIGPYKMELPNLEGGSLAALVRSIVYQQLSGKAAATIYGRLRSLFTDFPSAEQLIALTDETLRNCGLSKQKISYLRDLCQKTLNQTIEFDKLIALDDEEAIEKLTEIKGIGRWSAQMFLMFHFNRPDIWPENDLGIRKAVMKLHDLPVMPTIKEMPRFGEPYKPFRSVASWYLWRSLD